MSQITNLKHDVENCLREINSAELVLASASPSTEEIDPSRHWFDVTRERLSEELKYAQQEQDALTAALKPGCDYFTLIRSVRALHKSIEATRESIENFVGRVRYLENPQLMLLEPALPPSE